MSQVLVGHLASSGVALPLAHLREGNDLKGFIYVCLQNGSSEGQNVALTVLFFALNVISGGLDCLICGLDCLICGLDCLVCGAGSCRIPRQQWRRSASGSSSRRDPLERV